jgi:curved DNA-binding protein CbpA
VIDLYALLGVKRGASPAELDRAFRKKAKELHPDKGGDAEAFNQLSQAIRVLRDPDKRAHYDRGGVFGENDRAAAPDPAIDLVKIEVEGLIAAFLNSDKGAIVYVDVVKIMTDAFDEKIAAIGRQMETLKADTVRLSDLADRFEADDNIISKMIAYKVRGLTQAMENAEGLIETHRAARALAASHKFRSDPLPPGGMFLE